MYLLQVHASFEHVAPGGRLVFVGLTNQSISFANPPFHQREITLFASRNSCGQFPRIIELIESGQIDTSPWITHRMGLLEVPDRFGPTAQAPDLVKAMIEVEA